MASCWLVLVLLVFGCLQAFANSEKQRFSDLNPQHPREIFSSEAGKIEAWDSNELPALCDADVGAKRLTLEPQSLAVPCYKDAPVLKVITKGCAKVGVINPLTDKVIDRKVFPVKKGDVIALPKGTACWIYNDGNERTEILEVANTEQSPNCGRSESFHLGSSKRGILTGFSKDLLAHAWDVSEDVIQQILENQKEGPLVKVDSRMRIPDYTTENSMFVDFLYPFSRVEPDVNVRDAGEARLLNGLKMHLLRNMKMSAACVRMKGGALTAPSWIHNAHKLVYVDGGKGRIQVVRENGEQALDVEVEEGQLVLIPANFPHTKLAGREGFRYASILTNDMPVESYLAGRNSVYNGMPRQLTATVFEIDEKLQQKIGEQRKDQAFLFPPRRQPRKE